MENRSFYNEILTEHNLHPEFKHDLQDADIVLEGVNPSCGDDIFLKLKLDGDVIADGAFVGDGCAISQASADIMLGMIVGKKKEDALKLGSTFMKMIQGEASEDEIDSLEEASALRDISHMPARVKCAVLGWRTLKEAAFHREGRLPQRPLAPLDGVLRAHGMELFEDGDLLLCGGQLAAGAYEIAGNVSSQYISGLLMALPLLSGDSILAVTGPLESAAYVAMTEDALQLSKLTIPKMEAMWAIPGQQRCHLPKRTIVEGDWSNTAFFLCMGALSKEGVTVEGLNLQSSQGDRGVLDVLCAFGAEVSEEGDAVTVKRGALHGVMIDAAPIPDLIPVLSVVASVAEGETRVENAYRLRLKESDRLASTANLLRVSDGERRIGYHEPHI